ncbi:MAG: hypothetical protein R3B99_19570 [Polyangiales bacterium]
MGYVDMPTGMLLAVNTVGLHPNEVLDLVAAATADLFQGPSVSSIEQMFHLSCGTRRMENTTSKRSSSSPTAFHIFLRGRS